MSEAAIQTTPRTDRLCKELMAFVDKYGLSEEKVRTVFTSVLGHACSLERELNEAEEKIAILNSGCARLTRDELIQRISEIGPERYKAGSWLDQRIMQAIAPWLARFAWLNRHPDAIYHSNEDGLSQQPDAGWYCVVVIEGKITRHGPFDTIEACIEAAQGKATDE